MGDQNSGQLFMLGTVWYFYDTSTTSAHKIGVYTSYIAQQVLYFWLSTEQQRILQIDNIKKLLLASISSGSILAKHTAADFY